MPCLLRPCLLRLVVLLVPLNSMALESLNIAAPAVPAYEVRTIAAGLDHPWSLAFLPDGRLLVTERPGRLRIIDPGSDDNRVSQPVRNVPAVFADSQGGLFDVVLHPEYAKNGWLYLSYAHGNAGANGTRLARARLDGNTLQDVEVLFTAGPLKDTPVHYGGRLAFLPDGTLLLSIGDGFDYRESSQKLDSHLGKIVRLKDDGGVPPGNPFVGPVFEAEGVRPEIWSYGHRNAQAVVVDERTRRVYGHEHGPAGGDELNWIGKGANYGWPIATYGRDYSGAAISPFTEHAGTTLPLTHWTPSIAPAGMAIVRGTAFPALDGDLLVAALKTREVRRVRISDEKVVSDTPLFRELGDRMRDVRVAADGTIWLLTDAQDGKVLQVVP